MNSNIMVLFQMTIIEWHSQFESYHLFTSVHFTLHIPSIFQYPMKAMSFAQMSSSLDTCLFCTSLHHISLVGWVWCPLRGPIKNPLWHAAAIQSFGGHPSHDVLLLKVIFCCCCCKKKEHISTFRIPHKNCLTIKPLTIEVTTNTRDFLTIMGVLN